MNVQEFAELAAGHALNALSPDDERAFLDALAEHPEWAGIVDADTATATALSEGVADVTPPPSIRAALLAQIAGQTPPAGNADAERADAESVDPEDVEPEPPLLPGLSAEEAALAPPVEPSTSTDMIQMVERRTWTRGVFALAASIVLLVALGFGAALVGELLTPKPAAVVALEQIEGAPDSQSAVGETADGAIVEAHWSESVAKAVVVTHDLPELESDQVYQAWFVRGETPVSAGTFEPGEGGSATALLSGGMDPGDIIALTVEPAGGSDAPTTDPIVAIPTA